MQNQTQQPSFTTNNDLGDILSICPLALLECKCCKTRRFVLLLRFYFLALVPSFATVTCTVDSSFFLPRKQGCFPFSSSAAASAELSLGKDLSTRCSCPPAAASQAPSLVLGCQGLLRLIDQHILFS